jgi:hypothetical protein
MTSKLDTLKAIDHIVIKYSPPMDDYDAGVIEGLRLARAEFCSYNNNSWNEIYGDTEYTEFRLQ